MKLFKGIIKKENRTEKGKYVFLYKGKNITVDFAGVEFYIDDVTKLFTGIVDITDFESFEVKTKQEIQSYNIDSL